MMIEGRQWTFSVSAVTAPNEIVCIVGSCQELGSWDPCRIVPMSPQCLSASISDNGTDWNNSRDNNTDSYEADDASFSFLEHKSSHDDQKESVWTLTTQLPLEQVQHRFCIAVKPEVVSNETRIFVIKRWETHFKPRRVPAAVSQTDVTVATFGNSYGQIHVESGWLVQDSAVHLKLCHTNSHPNPIRLWKKKHKNKKVTPVELGAEGQLLEDTNEHSSSRLMSRVPAWPLIEVAVMAEEECSFKTQSQFGQPYDQEHFTVFQCRLLDASTTAFMFDFYVEENVGSDVPHFIGCSYLLPSNLIDNFGKAIIPITSPRHQPIGEFCVHYMVVKPMSPPGLFDMSSSFTRYWNETWKGLEVGHRGSGNSYHNQPKSCANIRENTIASLKHAAQNGADMVEIDVQLSRDFVPVIYHDFHACIALKRKHEQQDSDLLEIPIKDLTLQQLQALKDLSHFRKGIPEDIFSYCDPDDMVYHKTEKGLSKFSDEQFEEHQPFPTLQTALETVPVACGFNIEVKWTMQLKDGTYELLHPFELNRFMDLILKVVLEYGGQRKIVFSCFHPDICSMLRLKQNKYPVLFLTQGITTRWDAYDDGRCSSIRQAVMYATSADILGINVHTEDLLRDPSQMELALRHNLIVFCWGDDNNDRSNIKFLKNLGAHAIIYDKIDVYNVDTEKKSVFLCDEEESLPVLESDLGSSTPTPSQPPEALSADEACPQHLS